MSTPTRRASNYRYRHSKKGMACHKRYRQSPAGRAACARAEKKWRCTPHGKAKRQDLELRRRYGMTLAEREQMFAEQKGLCALCGEPLLGVFKVDHDHDTRKVRGLIHHKCNWFLGAIESMFDLVPTAVLYINKNKGEMKNG